ncbi:hypothetical protein L207DRAFT_444955 [Hyaloscypha variabilis F]|uniref:NAD(P)-binding protein n=1 Tax=Hyaloscypha variabilis (strain UAMH 11265 / GT02V1 / F) TaxID=1149755 RepID=A0A2J6QTT0_HYAVF|nr:hypothetical protein L207DRAFT_444955 [Hyaloscypha variabilis F]
MLSHTLSTHNLTILQLVRKPQPAKVDLLILGAGWTSTFLIPLLTKEKITYAATTTTGRDGTYKFKFSEPSSPSEEEEDLHQYAALPAAKTILITFPIKSASGTRLLVDSFTKTHEKDNKPYQWIQLGSTGIWSIDGQETWVTRHSEYDRKDVRAVAEDALLEIDGCVLNLSGLWGGERKVKHWVDRVAATKEMLSGKMSLHMIHGEDVARGIIAVHKKFDAAKGQRFMLTDLFVYDWWSLLLGYCGEIDVGNGNDERAKKQIKWIGELMEETGVRALPRSMEILGRCYDTREFWTTFGLMPTRARL